MKNFPNLLLSAAVAVLVSFLFVTLSPRGNGERGADTLTGSTYERVINSGTIRAAYLAYPPGTSVDPNSGEVTGIFPDLLAEMAKNMELKLEYVEEVGWGTMIAGLDSDRYDIVGTPVWANSVRGKLTTMSDPVYYSGIGIWTRPDESRFTPEDNWSSINNPDVKIAAMDGSTPELIANTMFPDATLVTYPDLTGEPQLFLDVTTKKVDIFFAEPSLGIDFLKSNPGRIKNIATDQPIKVFPNIILMKKGQPQLKHMLDVAIDELANSGVIDKVLQKYEPGPNAFYRVARPYALPE